MEINYGRGVALLRTYADDGYRPDYSTLAIRDSFDHIEADAVDPDGFQCPEEPYEDELTGTLATSGYSWLQAVTGGDWAEENRAELEAHDGAPPAEPEAWDDMVEGCYGATTGWVGLDALIPGDLEAHLRLGPPGLYRARFARRPAPRTDGDIRPDLFRVQFWPVAGPTPPQWLRRAVPGHDFLREDFVLADIAYLTRWSPGRVLTTSVEELARRLLLTPERIAGALAYRHENPLEVEGDAGHAGSPLTVRLRRG